VELDWDVRQKSRFAATDSQGRELASFCRAARPRGGDVLVAEDGPDPRAGRTAESAAHHRLRGARHAFDLMRAAYHLGNRHVPIELQPDHLKIEPDHVLADMLRSMHMTVVEADLPFEPEGGAYGGHVTNDGHSHHHHGHGAPATGPQPWPRTASTPMTTAMRTDHGHGHDHGKCNHG
jgi:urease accessory protein